MFLSSLLGRLSGYGTLRLCLKLRFSYGKFAIIRFQLEVHCFDVDVILNHNVHYVRWMWSLSTIYSGTVVKPSGPGILLLNITGYRRSLWVGLPVIGQGRSVRSMNFVH